MWGKDLRRGACPGFNGGGAAVVEGGGVFSNLDGVPSAGRKTLGDAKKISRQKCETTVSPKVYGYAV
jgi:hypothetical protein